jgi:hypothetical protein
LVEVRYDLPVPEFDTSKPSIARVYDYYLGGKDNFAVDRELAEKLIAMYPPIAQKVRENRKFLASAVSWVASRGVSQFIDLGAGLPTSPSTHEAAQVVSPSARVVYVDNDPVVNSHLNALVVRKAAGVTAIDGDVWHPAEIVASPLLTASINLREPACVIMGFLLHFIDAPAARALIGGYAAKLAPGSYFVISIARAEGELGDSAASTYNAQAFASAYNHGLADFESFFDGMDIVPPGAGQAEDWRPGAAELLPSEDRAGQVLVGVGHLRELS